MKIALGSDHAGFEYKQAIHAFLVAAGHEVHDFGTYSTEPVDYPDFIRPAAQSVARGQFECAVVLGGSGNGEAMVANRLRGPAPCAVLEPGIGRGGAGGTTMPTSFHSASE